MTRRADSAGPGSTEPPLPALGQRFDGSLTRHGTPSGFTRHVGEGTEPCEACRTAKAHYDWRWRQATARTKKNRLRARAQAMALAELRRRHLEEYDELYDARVLELFEGEGLEPPDPRRRTREKRRAGA